MSTRWRETFGYDVRRPEVMMSTHTSNDPRASAVPQLTSEGRQALIDRADRLRCDVLDPLREHLMGPERDERDVAEFERALAEIERLEAIVAASIELPKPSAGRQARVAAGSRVSILDAMGERVWVRPVHPEEATIDEERISWDSPLGIAIWGAAAGDRVDVTSPQGRWVCEVVRITR